MEKRFQLSDFVLGIICICFVILISGCVNTQLETTVIQPTKQITDIPTSQPTQLTATSKPVIPSPDKTGVTETRLPTYTSTPEITVTFTPFPTLDSEEIQAAIQKLFSKNANCTLPCFGGIYPGISSLEEARTILIQNGYPWTGTEYQAYSLNGKTFDTLLNLSKQNVSFISDISLLMVDDQNKVESLLISIDGKDISNVAPFFQIPSLVKELGTPDRVWISMTYMQGQPGTGYQIRMFYDDLGIAINYPGVAKLSEGKLVICPSDRNKYLPANDIASYGENLYLQDPTSTRKLEYLIHIWGEIIPNQTHTFEEATGLSLDNFYNMVTSVSNQECFTSPKDLWVVP